MNILRGCDGSLRGKMVGWPGFEPGTSGLKVPRECAVSLGNYSISSLRLSAESIANSSAFGCALRDIQWCPTTEAWLDTGRAMHSIGNRGNHLCGHCLRDPRQISGQLPAASLPSYCSRLRPAHRTPESALRRPDRVRAQAEGLRSVHSGTIGAQGRSAAGAAACCAVRCIHAGCIVLVHPRFKYFARCKKAEAAPTRSTYRSSRVRSRALRCTATCATHDGSGPATWPAPGRSACPEVGGPERRPRQSPAGEDGQASCHRDHAGPETDLREVLAATEPRRVPDHSFLWREVYERRLSRVMAKGDECVLQTWRNAVHFSRHTRAVCNKVFIAGNRDEAPGPHEYRNDFARISKGRRASEGAGSRLAETQTALFPEPPLGLSEQYQSSSDARKTALPLIPQPCAHPTREIPVAQVHLTAEKFCQVSLRRRSVNGAREP